MSNEIWMTKKITYGCQLYLRFFGRPLSEAEKPTCDSYTGPGFAYSAVDNYWTHFHFQGKSGAEIANTMVNAIMGRDSGNPAVHTANYNLTTDEGQIAFGKYLINLTETQNIYAQWGLGTGTI